MTSAKLIPAADTSTRTCPGPTAGSGRSSTRSVSGGPCLVMTTALMRPSLFLGDQRDRAAVGEAVARGDLRDHRGVHRLVGGHDHHLLPRSAGLVADGGR